MKTEVYKKVPAQANAILADKSLNIKEGTISMSEVRPFDKAEYLTRKDLKQSQKDWGSKLNENDGTLIVTINNSEGQFPVSQWVSQVKACGERSKCFDESGDELKPLQGAMFSFKNGILLGRI